MVARVSLSLTSVLVVATSVVSGLSADVGPLVTRTWNGEKYACKTYYDDPLWQNPAVVKSINASVDGNLQLVIPPGASCHHVFEGPLGNITTYDAAKCAQETLNFANEQWTTDQPAAALWTYFTNDTCRPTSDPLEPCTLGNYGVYVIMAKKKEHIRAGVQFAKLYGMRLIIRNTGHDFLGRSTGWGSLIINTHDFKHVSFTSKWEGPGEYKGSAVTVGAGVQGRELLRLAHAQKPPLSVVVGECPTVGVAGGLPGGGGHGPLTTIKGWAVDNALEFTVITADGRFLTANEKQNADLFWALRGGGPGNYAVIWTVTYKTHVDLPSSGVILNINGTHTNDTNLFWKGITAFHKHSNHYSNNGLYVYYVLGMGPTSVNIQPFVGFNKTAMEITSVLQPLYDDLKALNLPYDAVAKSYPTLFDLYIDQFEDEGAGNSALTGGWMFSQSDVASNNDGIISSFQNVVANGGFMIGHMWNAGYGIPKSQWNDTATHPAFRNASDFVITGLLLAGNAPLKVKEKTQRLLTDVIDAGLRAAGPGGASYVNENDPLQPGWQSHFWGREGYQRLLGVKRKYDPEGVFYSVSTPGSEEWVQIEGGTRLCKRI